jgi:hypothetical protein
MGSYIFGTRNNIHIVDLAQTVPMLHRALQQFLADTFSFLPFVGGTVAGPSYFIAGLILAIMILPTIASVCRDVMRAVPTVFREGALALGATRWEMIRLAVLPYSRAGISGAAMLGLGRAIGETIAVTIVIGNSPEIGKTIFSQGYTLAAVIANEFGEAASNKTHRAALIAAGLVLFVLTLLVNAIARLALGWFRLARPHCTIPLRMGGLFVDALDLVVLYLLAKGGDWVVAGQILGLPSRAAIDNAAFAFVPGDKVQQLTAAIALSAHGEAQVRPVEAMDEDSWRTGKETAENVPARGRVGRRSERQHLNA